MAEWCGFTATEMKRIITALVLVLSACWTAGAWLFVIRGTEPEAGSPYKNFFWMVGNKNVIFSEQVIRHIGATSGEYIVWGIGSDGYIDDANTIFYPQYEPETIYQRLKQINPDVNVLGYLRGATDYAADQTCRRILDAAGFTLEDYVVNHDLTPADLPLQDYIATNGTVYPYSNGFQLDWTQPDVKEKYLSGIQTVVHSATTHCDGVMFDNFTRTVTLSGILDDAYESYLNQGVVSQTEYDRMILDYRTNVEGFINTLSHQLDIPAMFGSINFRVTDMGSVPQITNDRYNDRPPLFPFSTGVYIEHFGGWTLDDGSFNKIATDANLHKLMSLTHDYPHNFFLYMGRNHQNAYVSYAEDYAWYRYIYAQYLLGAQGSNSSFRYWPSGALEPNPFVGRIFCYETMGDQDVNLGQPLQTGWTTNSQSLYSRAFENGVVVLNPHDKGTGGAGFWVNNIGVILTDIDGAWAGVYSNGASVWLENSTAKILLKSSDRDTRKDRWIDFEQADHWGGYMENAAILDEGANRFLSLSRMISGAHKEHDIALYMSKTMNLTNSASLRMRVRSASGETNAQILAMAEVDDTQGEHMFAVFETRNFSWTDGSFDLGPDSTPRATENYAIHFRAWDRFTEARVPADSWSGTDWTDVEIDAAALLADPQVMRGGETDYSGRFTFKRWVFVRFIGGVDIDDIQAGPCRVESQILRDN